MPRYMQPKNIRTAKITLYPLIIKDIMIIDKLFSYIYSPTKTNTTGLDMYMYVCLWNS
jgi:hypothetical protein